MGGGHNETPRGWRADTGRGNRYAEAAGTPKITQSKGRAKLGNWYHITPEGGESFTIEARGRDAWALDRLREAGLQGCTPIEQPAPRWSAYVHNLRELGVPIATVHEQHFGEYPGRHGRYVLRAKVTKGGGA